jgi:hypothetical protein
VSEGAAGEEPNDGEGKKTGAEASRLVGARVPLAGERGAAEMPRLGTLMRAAAEVPDGGPHGRREIQI